MGAVTSKVSHKPSSGHTGSVEVKKMAIDSGATPTSSQGANTLNEPESQPGGVTSSSGAMTFQEEGAPLSGASPSLPLKELISQEIESLPLSSDDSEYFVSAYELFKKGQFEESIPLFGRYARALIDLKKQMGTDQNKIAAINEDLDSTIDYLNKARQGSLKNFTNTFTPLSCDQNLLERELANYDQRAQATLGRMVNYPLPDCDFKSVVGLGWAKDIITKAILNPIKHGSLFEKKAKTTGVLLFGPTCTGKSLLAQATIGECKGLANILVVKSGDLMSKWAGDPQKIIDSLFQFASANGPSLIFLDESDHIFQDRNSGKRETSESLGGIQMSLLQNFDQLRSGCGRTFVISCTNYPNFLDDAFARRLSYKLFIGPPKPEDRLPLLKSFVGNHNSISDEEWQQIFEETSHLNIAGMKSHVQVAKDSIEAKITAATHFVFIKSPAMSCPQWVACLPDCKGSVQTSFHHFSNIYCPKLTYRFISQKQFAAKGKHHSDSYRNQMRCTREELDVIYGVKSDGEGSFPQSMYDDYIKDHKETCYTSESQP